MQPLYPEPPLGHEEKIHESERLFFLIKIQKFENKDQIRQRTALCHISIHH